MKQFIYYKAQVSFYRGRPQLSNGWCGKSPLAKAQLPVPKSMTAHLMGLPDSSLCANPLCRGLQTPIFCRLDLGLLSHIPCCFRCPQGNP